MKVTIYALMLSTSYVTSIGVLMVGGYLDDKVNEVLGIDGVFETTHNILIFGKK